MEPTGEASGKEVAEGNNVLAVTTAVVGPTSEGSDDGQSEPDKLEVPVQEMHGSTGDDSGGKEPEAMVKAEPVAQESAVPSDQSPPAAAEGAPVVPNGVGDEKPEVKPEGEPQVPQVPATEIPSTEPAPATEGGTPVVPPVGEPSEVPAPEASGSPAAAGGEKPEVKPQGESQAPANEAKPQGEPQAPANEVPGVQPAAGGEDDFSLFDSQADLEEIFSAMEDVKKDEANAIATAVQALESGQDAATALQSVSTEVAEKIQKQLEERTAAEEEHFVTEEEFVSHAKASLSKTWYHCLYFLTFKSETGVASKKVMYDSLKEALSKSPVDVLPEHMFNFGLSTLIKVMLYEKPIVTFKRGGEFKLEVKRKKMQELLQQIGPPMSKRPVVTKKEEKKMISDFFNNDKLF